MTLGGVHFYRVRLCVGVGLGRGQNMRLEARGAAPSAWCRLKGTGAPGLQP